MKLEQTEKNYNKNPQIVLKRDKQNQNKNKTKNKSIQFKRNTFYSNEMKRHHSQKEKFD